MLAPLVYKVKPYRFIAVVLRGGGHVGLKPMDHAELQRLDRVYDSHDQKFLKKTAQHDKARRVRAEAYLGLLDQRHLCLQSLIEQDCFVKNAILDRIEQLAQSG